MKTLIKIDTTVINLNAIATITFDSNNNSLIINGTTTLDNLDDNTFKIFTDFFEYEEVIEPLTLIEGLTTIQESFEENTPEFKLISNRLKKLNRSASSYNRAVKYVHKDFSFLNLNTSIYESFGWVMTKPIESIDGDESLFEIDESDSVETNDKPTAGKIHSTPFTGFKIKDTVVKSIVKIYSYYV